MNIYLVCISFFLCVGFAIIDQARTDNGYVQKIDTTSKIAIKPLMSCDGPTEGADKVIRKFLNQCPDMDRPYAVEKWRIYDKVQPAGSINVFHCAAMKEVWRYEKSWLLSRSDGVLVESSRIDVNVSYCMDLMKKKCGGKPCNLIPSHKYIPEYHYASTTYKTYIYGTGQVIRVTSYVVDGNKIYLHGLRSSNDEVEMSLGNTTSDSKKDSYVWNEDDIHTGCHLKTYISVQCLRSSNHLMCGNVGVYATLEGTVSLINCKNEPESTKGQRLFYKSDLGLWLEEDHSESKITNRQYLNLPPGPVSLNEKDLINGINEIIRVKNEKDCVSSCLNIRKGSLEPGKVDLVGYNYMIERNNSLTMCRPLYDCKVERDSALCSNPTLIRVRCGSESFWWSPTLLYVDPRLLCMGSSKEIQHFTVLTNIGPLYINRSGVYYLSDQLHNSEIIHPIPRTNQMSENVITFFIDTIKTTHDTTSDSDDLLTHIETDRSFFSGIWFSVREIKDWISSFSQIFRTCLFGCIIISLLALIYFLFNATLAFVKNMRRTDTDNEIGMTRSARIRTKNIERVNRDDHSREVDHSDVVFM